MTTLSAANLRRFIVLVGLAQAGLLLAALATGTFSGSPAQWSLLAVFQGAGLASATVRGLFMLVASVWLVATLAWTITPERAWLLLLSVALVGAWFTPYGVWLSLLEAALLGAHRWAAARA